LCFRELKLPNYHDEMPCNLKEFPCQNIQFFFCKLFSERNFNPNLKHLIGWRERIIGLLYQLCSCCSCFMSPLLWLLYEHEKLNLTRCLLEFDWYSNSRDEYFRCYCKQILYQTIFTVLPYILILSKFYHQLMHKWFYLTLSLILSYIYIYIYIYIYGALILDVSRSHTTTHHSR
jgi:hypothetical protein